MIAYLTTDSLPDIVSKNKQNIEYLIGEFASGGISYKELVAKVEVNTQAVTKAVADAASAQATADEAKTKTLTNEQAITAANTAIRANANAIAAAVVNINANTAAIARILNNGIGGYLGTFTASDGDDFTVLPKTAKDAERAITEFPRGTDIYYQEWVWNDPDGWTKLGTPTDSHIHSQSAGISLADVAAQQDPKISAAKSEAITSAVAQAKVLIAASLDTAKKYSDEILSPYEDKEITIPAVTNIRKTKGKTLYVIKTIFSIPPSEDFSDIVFTEAGGVNYIKVSDTEWHQARTNGSQTLSGVIKLVGKNLNQTAKPDFNATYDFEITTIETITPEQKFITLVKK